MDVMDGAVGRDAPYTVAADGMGRDGKKMSELHRHGRQMDLSSSGRPMRLLIEPVSPQTN